MVEEIKKLLIENMPKIEFLETEHQYWFNRKRLFGITKLINELLYDGKKYANIPKYILEQASQKGSLIHKEIEMWCKTNELGFTKELQKFIELKNELKFEVLGNEYTVTDYEKYATNIDLILWNGEIELCDIKTTSKLDLDYLSWQLSINAYLLENVVKCPVNKLSAFWTRSGEIVPVERKTNEQVKEFLYGDFKKQEIILNDSDKIISIQKTLNDLEEQKKSLEKQYESLKVFIISQMQEKNIKQIDNDMFKITYIDEQKREMLDSKLLKEENPEIAEKYKRITTIKPSIRITIKGAKND